MELCVYFILIASCARSIGGYGRNVGPRYSVGALGPVLTAIGNDGHASTTDGIPLATRKAKGPSAHPTPKYLHEHDTKFRMTHNWPLFGQPFSATSGRSPLFEPELSSRRF